MPQQHQPGYRLQIDFAGDPLCVIEPLTRARVECPVLVCTLPCSSFFYVEPLSSARQEHLIPALNRALTYLGGVSKKLLRLKYSTPFSEGYILMRLPSYASC